MSAGTDSLIRVLILLRRLCSGSQRSTGSSISAARLVANPGCYPTSMILGLLPVVGDIDDFGVIVDSKSGVSGAGRTPTEKTHFCAVDDNFRAYGEVGHRHTAEMIQELGAAAGASLPVSFTPHLLPVDRGILSTMYFRPADRPWQGLTLGWRNTGLSTRTSLSWK